ncbi:MAG TPA: hypothetical protein VIG48_05715 [Jatrophihabitans sp.]
MLIGALVAVIVVVVARRDPSASTAPPGFGASLPVHTPAAASGTPSGRAAGDAELTDAPGVQALLAAATSAVQTVDSYDYRRVDANRAAGDKVTADAFRPQYDLAMQRLAKPAAAAHTVQQAVVQKVGVTALAGDRAGALALGRLDITSAADPAGSSSDLTVGITLQRSGHTWLITGMTDLADQGEFAATPPGNAALVGAVTAAGHEVVHLLSYRRAEFAADFDRALAGLTGPLLAQQTQRRAGLLASMTRDRTDYTGQVRSIGVESASGSSVLVVVCASGYSTVPGSPPQSGTERFEVGVQYVGGRWLVAEYLALPSAG